MSAGRKIFDGKDPQLVIQKLEWVWALGGSDAEAAFFADISPAALSAYLKNNKEISERKEALKNKPTLAARQSVVFGLENSPEFALKYLERKMKREFAPLVRQELAGPNGEPIQTQTLAPIRKKMLKKAMDELEADV